MTSHEATILHAKKYRAHASEHGRKALSPSVVNRIAKDVAATHPDFDMATWKRVVAGEELRG